MSSPETELPESDVDITPIDTSRMSEGKREALELAEASREASGQLASFAAGIFMGDFDWDLVHPFPEQPAEDVENGRHLHEEMERILREQTDPDAIDRDGEIPDEVMKAFADLGAFGIKIPKEYGGLGLSQLRLHHFALPPNLGGLRIRGGQLRRHVLLQTHLRGLGGAGQIPPTFSQNAQMRPEFP